MVVVGPGSVVVVVGGAVVVVAPLVVEPPATVVEVGAQGGPRSDQWSFVAEGGIEDRAKGELTSLADRV